LKAPEDKRRAGRGNPGAGRANAERPRGSDAAREEAAGGDLGTGTPDPSIILKFDRQTLANLRSAIFVRGLTGNAGGLLDAFVAKLVKKLEEGAGRWHVKQKHEMD
jgi:hypothetical protein